MACINGEVFFYWRERFFSITYHFFSFPLSLCAFILFSTPIFINSFHNIYFVSNISFAYKKNEAIRIREKSEIKWKKLGKRTAKRTCFCSILFSLVQFYSCSLMLLFSLPFRIVSLPFPLSHCVCVSFFFLAAALLSIISVPFHAWLIV